MDKQTDSKSSNKIKIGLVQINNSFQNQTYFPYSLGILQAYAQKHLKNIDNFEFLLPIFKRIPLKDALEKLSGALVIFFSVYVWNFKLSLKIAEEIKKLKPETLIVFGGCQIPKSDVTGFLKQHSFIDVVCYGEGERVFTSILENFKTRSFENIDSIAYTDKNNEIIKNKEGKRIDNLNEIPSPYLEGIFNPLIKENPNEVWLGLWETNRGCPFSCSFCEWGGDYHKILRSRNIEELFAEIDWFSKNKVEFIFCCDSNFGIFPRDLEIVSYVVKNKEKYGYPKSLSVQNTKNFTEKTYEIQKLLAKSGLSKGVNLAFQSLNEETLKSIGRKNISNETYHELQKRFTKEGIETFSDIILGLPNETYDSFTEGISRLIKSGQYNKIQFINLSILPNAEMANPEYTKKYGFKVIETKMINIHGSLNEEEVYETQNIVVETNTMPRQDWIKSRNFSWMCSLLYFNKLLQVPFTILNKEYHFDYKELIEEFLNINSKEFSVLSDISSFFIKKAADIQNGNPEFFQSKEFLNIWWPADELMFIKLCAENKLDNFYKEAEIVINNLLKKKAIAYDPLIITESILLNKSLIKLPFQVEDLKINLSYNIWEAYRGHLTGESIFLQKNNFDYTINRTNEKWNSWDDWCQKVVWYGNKKGAYVYQCIPS